MVGLSSTGSVHTNREVPGAVLAVDSSGCGIRTRQPRAWRHSPRRAPWKRDSLNRPKRLTGFFFGNVPTVLTPKWLNVVVPSAVLGDCFLTFFIPVFPAEYTDWKMTVHSASSPWHTCWIIYCCLVVYLPHPEVGSIILWRVSSSLCGSQIPAKRNLVLWACFWKSKWDVAGWLRRLFDRI